MPEVIPSLVLVIGLFFAVVGYLTARGLLATWTHSLGYVFQWLASQLPDINTHIPGVPRINLKAPFQAIDHWVITALQTWADGAEIQIGYTLHGLRQVALYTAEAIDYLGRETAETFDWLARVHIPRWAKLALGPLLLPLLLPRILRYIQAHVTPSVLKTVLTVTHEVTHTVTRVVVKTGAVALPGALGIPKIWREIHGLTKRWARINIRLRKVEALLGVTAMAAAMANVLGLPNWRCLTRGNVGRLARGICGMPAHWLNDLLGLLTDFIILESLCDVLPWLEVAASEIATPFVETVTTIAQANKGCLSKTAPTLVVPQLYLAPPVDSLLAGV